MKRYHDLPQELFRTNRANFIAKMKPNSLAIFHSGDIFLQSADANHSFVQDPDLYYLTGIDQEETILVLYPDAPIAAWREVLYIRETSDHIKVWEGYKLTKEEAHQISGIHTIVWNSSYMTQLNQMMHATQTVYINLNEHDRAQFDGDYMNLRKYTELKELFPLHTYERSQPILSELRRSKSPMELNVMQKAADITSETFVKVLKEFRHFKTEHELEAFITYQFQLNRVTHAYNPIIASGENSCILHYNDNNRPLVSGDIMLMDFGCSYSNYASDLSRTIPVSGKYSERQRVIYQATLDVFYACRDLVSNAISLQEYNTESKKIMESKLIEIGLLNKAEVQAQDPMNPLYKKYFPHGVSHYLGLNVHDVGSHYLPIVSDAVLTCEPGIYIAAEGLGVRIENDLVVSSTGCIDLLKNCPIEIAAIEDLMHS